MDDKRPFRGVWIPAEIWLAEGFSLIEKCLLIEIDSLAELERGCIAGNAHFAKFLGVGKTRVSQLINGLARKGFLKIEMKLKPNSKQIAERRILPTPLFKKLKGGIKKNNRPLYKINYPPLENDKGNNTRVTNTINNTAESYQRFLLAWRVEPNEVLENKILKAGISQDDWEKIDKHLPRFLKEQKHPYRGTALSYIAKKKWINNPIQPQQSKPRKPGINHLFES